MARGLYLRYAGLLLQAGPRKLAWGLYLRHAGLCLRHVGGAKGISVGRHRVNNLGAGGAEELGNGPRAKNLGIGEPKGIGSICTGSTEIGTGQMNSRLR